MFKVTDFQYDGKSSTDFELKIVNFDSGGMKTENVGLPISIEEDKVKRIDKPFFFGVEITPKLKFTLQIAYIPNDSTVKQISPLTSGRIMRWLCRKEYKPLKIIDSDYSNIVYNCMIANPRRIEIGNVIYAFEVDVECDRPYGYYKQTITKTIVNSGNLQIKNMGNYPDAIFPKVQFTLSGAQTNLQIWNTTYDPSGTKSTVFTNLNQGETINFDNQTQIIVSSTGLNRNTNFNFNWFRLTENYINTIIVNGSCTITIETEYPVLF